MTWETLLVLAVFVIVETLLLAILHKHWPPRRIHLDCEEHDARAASARDPAEVSDDHAAQERHA